MPALPPVPDERLSHTPGPVSPAPPPASPSPSSPPASTAALVTALPLQLAALAIVTQPMWWAARSLLSEHPSEHAWKILGLTLGVVALVAAPTPSITAATGLAATLARRFLPGGK